MKKHILTHIILASIAAVILFPIIFIIASSFMGKEEILNAYGGVLSGNKKIDFHIIPYFASTDAYYKVFLETPLYLIKFWSSLFIALIITLGHIAISILGGFAFAKFKFPFKNLFFLFVIILMMMPLQVSLVPQYIILDF